MHTARLAAAGTLVAALAAGCGPNPAALSVPDAQEAGGEVVVEGYVVADEAGLRLCEAVAESYPPRCGGASLTVRGVGAGDFEDLRREGDRSWSDTQRRLRGTVDGDAIVVTDPDA